MLMMSGNNWAKSISSGSFVIIAALCLSVIILLLGQVHASTLVVDNNRSIQSQINSASPGDVLLLANRSYNESIVVDKPVTIRGAGMSVIDGQGNDSAILLAADGVTLLGLTAINSSGQGLNVISNNNTIKNNTIEACVTGIAIFNSSNNTIENNIVSNNEYGIQLDSAKNNRLIGNNASYNDGHGIYFLNSDGNICNYNQASYNVGNGFYIESSSHNLFDSCIAMNNAEKGFELDGSHANNGTGIIARNNSVGIYIYESRDDIINGCSAEKNADMGMQIFDSINSSFVENNLYNNTLRGLDLTQISKCLIQGNDARNNGDHGLFILDSVNTIVIDNHADNNREIGMGFSKVKSCTIANNSAQKNIIGIALFNSKNNNISNNRAELNAKGLSFERESNSNTVIENIIGRNAAGITLIDSIGNLIENNSINNSEVSALQRSSFNIIINNSITNNKIGLYLNRSDNNSIGENDFDDNGVGIAINVSTNNTLENRTFTNNDYDVIINKNESLLPNILGMEIVLEKHHTLENVTFANNSYNAITNDNKTLSSNALWDEIMLDYHPENFLGPYERGAKRYIETPDDTTGGHMKPISVGKDKDSGESGTSIFISIESICDAYFDSLAGGKMLLKAPDKMNRTETYTVEAYISRNYTLNLSSNPSLKGVDRWFNLDKIGEYMGLKLDGGSAFQIDPPDECEKHVSKTNFTTWTWKVTPLLAGNQTLTLVVSTYYKHSFEEKAIPYSHSIHRDVEVIPKEIVIQVEEPEPKKDILNDITSSIGGIVTLLIGILTLIKLYGEVSKRKKE